MLLTYLEKNKKGNKKNKFKNLLNQYYISFKILF